MTKKDFELIAETIANLPRSYTGDNVDRVIFDTLISELADMCASTNGNFDRARFLNACLTPNYRAPRNVSRY